VSLTTWLTPGDRAGEGALPAVAVAPDARDLRLRIDASETDFRTDQAIIYTINWSSDGEAFRHLGGGTIWGGPLPARFPERQLRTRLPDDCTHVQVKYDIVNGPIHFGLSGEVL
jgi:hypothetical protein